MPNIVYSVTIRFHLLFIVSINLWSIKSGSDFLFFPDWIPLRMDDGG